MVPVGLRPLQVVQATVQMHDVGFLPEHPFVNVGEHVGAVAAVLRRADDDGLAGEPLGNPSQILYPFATDASRLRRIAAWCRSCPTRA